MRAFSLGSVWAVPNVANPTPVPVASLKDFKVTVKQAKKGFRGPYRDIIDVGDGARDWSIEIGTADFRASAFALVAGGTTTTGGRFAAIGEQIAIGATNTAAQGANFVEDGGVFDATANKWLARVASAPAVGQYSGPSGIGVYTFNAGDAGHVAYLVYSYSSSTLGVGTVVSNSLQSQSIAYKVRLYAPYTTGGSSRLIGVEFPSVHFEELSLDFKAEDFAAHGLKGIASQDMIGITQQTVTYWSSELG